MDLLLKLQPVHLYQKVEDALLKIEQLHKSLARLETTVDAIKKALDATIPLIAELVASRRTDEMEIVVDP